MADRKRATAKPKASADTGRDVYVANFDGDEINGRRYEIGEEIAADVDAGTIAYLEANGRITHSTKADSKQPAVGGAPDASSPPADPLADVTLSEEETAARDKLVADAEGNADQLREIATEEKAEGVTTDQDAATVATLIVVHRRATA